MKTTAEVFLMRHAGDAELCCTNCCTIAAGKIMEAAAQDSNTATQFQGKL
jgi:hypothetical protein